MSTDVYDDTMKRFDSARLQQLRIARGWTQMQTICRLWKATGLSVSPSTFSRWESGQRTPWSNSLAGLAEVFGLDPGAFFVEKA